MPRAIRSAFVSGFLILLPFLLAYLLIPPTRSSAST